jgi:hypothetical protein
MVHVRGLWYWAESYGGNPEMANSELDAMPQPFVTWNAGSAVFMLYAGCFGLQALVQEALRWSSELEA